MDTNFKYILINLTFPLDAFMYLQGYTYPHLRTTENTLQHRKEDEACFLTTVESPPPPAWGGLSSPLPQSSQPSDSSISIPDVIKRSPGWLATAGGFACERLSHSTSRAPTHRAEFGIFDYFYVSPFPKKSK